MTTTGLHQTPKWARQMSEVHRVVRERDLALARLAQLRTALAAEADRYARNANRTVMSGTVAGVLRALAKSSEDGESRG